MQCVARGVFGVLVDHRAPTRRHTEHVQARDNPQQVFFIFNITHQEAQGRHRPRIELVAGLHIDGGAVDAPYQRVPRGGNYFFELLLGVVAQNGKGAPPRLLGRYLGLAQPTAVGVMVKVILRPHALVYIFNIKSPIRLFFICFFHRVKVAEY